VIITDAAITAKPPKMIVITLRPQIVASNALPGINAKLLGFVDEPRATKVAPEVALAPPATLPRERLQDTNDQAERE